MIKFEGSFKNIPNKIKIIRREINSCIYSNCCLLVQTWKSCLFRTTPYHFYIYPRAKYARNFSTKSSQKFRVPYRKKSQMYIDDLTSNIDEWEEKWRIEVNEPDKKYKYGITEWIPSDWRPNPRVAQNLLEPELRRWALHLNSLWLNLGRITDKDNARDPSLIPLPHGFMVPGPQFDELHYWESYWILRGLLTCHMYRTVRGVIRNLSFLVDNYEHVPKGARYYFRGRSGPPMLASMVHSYYTQSYDTEFLKSTIQYIEKELEFWRKYRTVSLLKEEHEHVLYQYHVECEHPRIECYGDDLRRLKWVEKSELPEHFVALNSASESTWVYSSRWCLQESVLQGDLIPTRTHRIVPVDLNAIIHQAYTFLRNWHRKLGDLSKANHYKKIAKDLLLSIEMVLWNDDEGIWLDYDLDEKKSRSEFYMSNLTPLWTKSFSRSSKEMSKLALDYINKTKIELYKGGIPVSKFQTRELWDFPNVCPGLQAFVAEGLHSLGTPEAKREATFFVQQLLRTVYMGFHGTKSIYDMYSCLEAGEPGLRASFSEFGHGPTNGVVLFLLDKWAKAIRFHDGSFDDEE